MSLDPYDGPWTRAEAAHLCRRAGFEPSMTELDRAVEDGPDATIERMLRGDEAEAYEELDVLGDRLAARDDIGQLRGWWLRRLCVTTRPLMGRLALLWHDHFATSNAKVASAPMMYAHLRTIESGASGAFRDLVLGMCSDPAMIAWLDGNENVKGRPNENFARELFELFTLGVGHYTEEDIKEAARAFTGWHQKRGRFRYSAHEHDDGEKSVLGRRGRFGGEEIVDIALEQDACAKFIATVLLRAFLTPRPDETIVRAIADRLRTHDFDIGRTTRDLLRSRVMFASEARRVRIKSPVELVVGMARSLDLEAPAAFLADTTSNMGQRLFEPPSVAGWESHRGWLDSATMLVRLNAARVAAEDLFDADATCATHEIRTADEARRFAIDITIGPDIGPSLRRVIEDVGGSAPEVLRRSIGLLMATPEYQMA